ncbi:MAG: tRNA pseudouridine(55) synthase TruB [Ruminobacter sp.]|nr:tRNA pseudouridine(55) synthase TruB [Ruminobacter sp.]
MPRRSKRDVSGILLLNKPQGITSNDAMIRIRGIFHAQKAGHTGALDPLATGMLPICLGEATKFAQFLLDSDKEYEVTARFGQRTTTSDAEGELVSSSPVSFTKAVLLEAMAKLTGTIEQVPSIYSALKYQGRPYYEYARKGIDIPREARTITIYSFSIDDEDFDRAEGDIFDIRMKVSCSKGTYIRSLIDDLGEILGCGAHVVRLNRTRVSTYPVERMVSFEDLNAIVDRAHSEGLTAFSVLDSLLLPVDTAVSALPEIVLDEVQGKDIMMGKRIKVTPVNMLTSDLQPIRIYVSLGDAAERRFIGVGEIRYDHLAPKRLISTAKLDDVAELVPEEIFE